MCTTTAETNQAKNKDINMNEEVDTSGDASKIESVPIGKRIEEATSVCQRLEAGFALDDGLEPL